MPKTHTVTTYDYDELDDKARTRARDWYRNLQQDDPDWAEFTIEDAVRMGGILGIEFDHSPIPLMGGGTRPEPHIYYQLHTQGSGAYFEGRYSYAAAAATTIKAEAPQDTELRRIARELHQLQRKHAYRLTARVKHQGQATYSRATYIEVYKGDEELSPEELGVDEPAAQELRQLLRDFMDWIYEQLHAEWDSRQTDEYIEAQLKDGDYEFTKEGKVWREQ